MMNLSWLLSFLICMSSFNLSEKQDTDKQVFKRVLAVNLTSILEPVLQQARQHELSVIAFTPLFERGAGAFSLQLEADFFHFCSWYQAIVKTIPGLYWQHLRLKPHANLLLIDLEGIYVA